MGIIFSHHLSALSGGKGKELQMTDWERRTHRGASARARVYVLGKWRREKGRVECHLLAALENGLKNDLTDHGIGIRRLTADYVPVSRAHQR